MLTQEPYQPSKIMGTITGPSLASIDGEVWKFTVHTFGDIRGEECLNVGPEIDPVYSAHTAIGREPPAESKIADVTITDPGDGVPFEFSQDKYLQNIGDIAGQAIKVTSM